MQTLVKPTHTHVPRVGVHRVVICHDHQVLYDLFRNAVPAYQHLRRRCVLPCLCTLNIYIGVDVFNHQSQEHVYLLWTDDLIYPVIAHVCIPLVGPHRQHMREFQQEQLSHSGIASVRKLGIAAKVLTFMLCLMFYIIPHISQLISTIYKYIYIY